VYAVFVRFMTGIFLKRKIKKFQPRLAIFLFVSFIFVLIATKTQAVVNFDKRVYYEPLLATIAASSGIYIILSISFYFGKNRLLTKIFTAFGAASLFVLIFHGYIGVHVYDILRHIPVLESELLLAILAFLASIVGPLIVRKVIMQSKFLMIFYFPFKYNKKSRFSAKVVEYMSSQEVEVPFSAARRYQKLSRITPGK